MRLPDPRTRLARVIMHPRVTVSLVALTLVAVPLGVLHHRDGGAPAAATLVATAPAASIYTSITTDADFNRGTRSGTTVSGGALRFGKAVGTRTFDGRTFDYASWTSPWIAAGSRFTQLVPSWNAYTPTGSGIQVLVRVRDTAGRLSTTKDLGRWATTDTDLKRASAGSQSDTVARVATDTVIAGTRALGAFQITVRLLRKPGGSSPALGSVGTVVSTPSSTLPATSVPLKKVAVSLAVPAYSQMTHTGQSPQYGGGGEAWCSPTSLSMVLGYYRRLPPASSYTWVPSSYADRWVNHVARSTYDYTYEGTGNWPFNTAYAATRTGSAFVTRLANLQMAERFVRAGIPVIASISFAKGQLHNAPISATAGHLLVIVGFTAAGNPIVNDPAAPSNKSVRRAYNRAEFERAWLRGSHGTSYIVTDADHPLPTRPTGVRNW